MIKMHNLENVIQKNNALYMDNPSIKKNTSLILVVYYIKLIKKIKNSEIMGMFI